jgi:hypothetical protein
MPILLQNNQRDDGNAAAEVAETAEEDNSGADNNAAVAAGTSTSSTAVVTTANNYNSNNTSQNHLLGSVLIGTFLTEHQRCLQAQWQALTAIYPPATTTAATTATAVATATRGNTIIFTVLEAQRSLFCLHLQQLLSAYLEAITYLEEMLYRQLLAAIGREVTPQDLTAYLESSVGGYRRLYAERYRPGPFSYTVRRSPKHSAEGQVSLVQVWPAASSASSSVLQKKSTTIAPIHTFSRRLSSSSASKLLLLFRFA